MHALSDLQYIDKRNYFDSLQIIDLFDFDQQIQYAISTGDAFRDPFADLLFNIINPSSYLSGQMGMEFKRNGIDPPIREIFYCKPGGKQLQFWTN